MSHALQVIVVAVAVCACALYSSWRLLSGAARQRTLELLARVPGLGSLGWFARLQARTRARIGRRLRQLRGCD